MENGHFFLTSPFHLLDHTKMDCYGKQNASTRINRYSLLCALLSSTNSILLGYDIGVMSGASMLIKENLKISRIQQEILVVRVGLLYIISSLGGSLVYALFIQSRITVGASGALAGLAGGSIAKSFIEYWTLHLPLMGFDLSLVVSMILVNVVVTIVQHGDNFANLGGSIIGALFGFVIFTRPPLNRLRSTALLIVIFVG
ncbi:unnamed protein product [Trifolium pratense]|uniref:Uncharacterized protein n=1 Tax=Trifolium pratense TaxID=57577 RepID=A0ACB0M4U9_TRIPR|nr:unnamed protein product [Trifolium pratense]